MTHIVVGAGQVGTAVHAVLASTAPTVLRDVAPVTAQADVLHICFPWTPAFTDAVHGYTTEHGADLVIVHSTVPVGTCDPHGWVHSPIRGKHPHLEKGVREFTKHFGGLNATQAAQTFHDAGVRVQIHDRAAETEAGKLWELVQYGVQVRVEKAIHAWCSEHNIDPDVVYQQFARTYNDGYQRLGDTQYVRPVLTHMPGPIGGHCVIPMSRLLDHPLAEYVWKEPEP